MTINETQKKLGLIAGYGRLPVDLARAARAEGITVVAIGVISSIDPELEEAADKLYRINIGQLGTIIATLKTENITEAIMIGKVSKELLFTGIKLDMRAMLLLAGLKDKSDDAIMLAFVNELAKNGITVLEQTTYIAPLLPAEGPLTKRVPTDKEWQDIRFGFAMAKKIGGLDIGQTVVVKDQAVLAVEAIEGTDAAIRRGGELARGGAVVVKVSKPNQDLRFDMPGIGPDTIQSMIAGGATVLAIEAGKTIIVDREKVRQLADARGISVVAVSENMRELGGCGV